jgi:hypothetical protein
MLKWNRRLFSKFPEFRDRNRGPGSHQKPVHPQLSAAVWVGFDHFFPKTRSRTVRVDRTETKDWGAGWAAGFGEGNGEREDELGR